MSKINANIKELNKEVKDSGDRENMFQVIMKQNIPDVLGRLGDLGTVPAQYDEIITSCFAGRLDNIVVRTYEAGNAVIDFLKREKIGRASCIILEKIKEYANYMRKNWKNLANSTRLFDVLNVQNE